MFKAFSVLLGAGLVFILDYRSLKANKKWDRRVYIVIFAISLGVWMLYIFNVQFPYVIQVVEKIYNPIFDSFNQKLEQKQSFRVH
ncbi:hypothetical protein SAMN05421676_105266 [Salinibacillus kushneri]|uniref:Uncharacterized protein n=1 Tax=Salinibacillus kushneri TaxID=237682 RepID=A0A1I0FB95_9BACI|nr:hypothetical protein [Salinibacillus kushneri]SET55225.1 hypothetical protein SAMN05421676_105266 [Salinibacillus kushneri]